MYIARKPASTRDERSRRIDSVDPFAPSQVPSLGAPLSADLAPLTGQLATASTVLLDTGSIAFGSFTAGDSSDHYRFTAQPATLPGTARTYVLVVTTDSVNGTIRSSGFADDFDLYVENGKGERLTANAGVQQLDVRTKLIEFTVPAAATTATSYFVQIDNARAQSPDPIGSMLMASFDYAIGLFDKAAAPSISVGFRELNARQFEIRFTADQELAVMRPRLERIEVQDGTLGPLARSADGLSYTAVFTPKAGAVQPKVQVLSGAFFDGDGNFNLDDGDRDNVVMPVSDTTAPELVSITSSEARPGLTSQPVLTFQFSEPVSGFGSDDVMVDGGRLLNFSGSGATYTAVLQRTGNQEAVTLQVGTDYRDLSVAQNRPKGAVSDTIRFDLQAPTAILTAPPNKTQLAPGETVTLQLRFSEGVAGFEATDVRVTDGTIGNLRALSDDGTRFTFDLTAGPDETRPTLVSLNPDLADLAGNRLSDTAFDQLSFSDDLSGLRLVQGPHVSDETVSLIVRHGASDAELQVQLAVLDSDDTVDLGSALNGGLTRITLTEQSDGLLLGDLKVTDGLREVDVGLLLGLGTSDADNLAVAADQPVALFGFGGNDTLGAGPGFAVLNGGAGVDRYELRVGREAATHVVEAGSPLDLALLGLPELTPIFIGFDLVTGFEVGTDRLHMDGLNLKTSRGRYDELDDSFTATDDGADLMVFEDAGSDANGQPDVGERAVVILAAGAAASTVLVSSAESAMPMATPTPTPLAIAMPVASPPMLAEAAPQTDSPSAADVALVGLQGLPAQSLW